MDKRSSAEGTDGAQIDPGSLLREGLHVRQIPGVSYDQAELGLAHRTRPSDVVDALTLARRGEVYDLESARWPSMPVLPVHPPFVITSYRTSRGFRNQRDAKTSYGRESGQTGVNTELVIGTVHTGTHIDALCHVTCGVESRGRGGYDENESMGDFGALTAEASSIPPFVCRGVLVDVAGHLGVEMLGRGHLITLEEMAGALGGTEIRPGDAVLFRTGYMRAWGIDDSKSERHYGSGIGVEVARELGDRGVVLVGADTEALERTPPLDADDILPVHVELLIRRGIFILELAYLEDLARDAVREFLFVCLPLRIVGATGSMVRPIAVI
jgi:kynurenine formamidase